MEGSSDVATGAKRNYAINGAGQIGTGILRINGERRARGESHLQITHITDSTLTCEQVADIMKYDPIYGTPAVDVRAEGDDLFIGDQVVRFVKEEVGQVADWASLGVHGVFEATGQRVKGELAEEHITKGGAKRVLITAPSKGNLSDGTPIKSLIMGFNEGEYDSGRDRVVDNASCTTKSAVPVVDALDGAIGVKGVFLETVHAETGGTRRRLIQNSGEVDDVNKLGAKPAPTGAKGALKKLFPHMDVEAEAYRIPVPDGSISDITLILQRATTVEEVRAILSDAVKDRVFQVVDKLESSADLIGNIHDSVAQIGEGKIGVIGNVVRVPAGYDNGYAPADAALHLMQHVDSMEQ